MTKNGDRSESPLSGVCHQGAEAMGAVGGVGFAIVRIVSAALLVLAIGHHPYGYYAILRWITCGVASYAAFRALELKSRGWTWVMGVLAAIFNPILPLHLDRQTWAPVDLAAALALILSILPAPVQCER